MSDLQAIKESTFSTEPGRYDGLNDREALALARSIDDVQRSLSLRWKANSERRMKLAGRSIDDPNVEPNEIDPIASLLASLVGVPR